MIRIAPHGAIERELAGSIRHELDGGHFSGFDRVSFHAEPPDGKAVDHVLRPNPEAHALALIHDDALARPPASGRLTGY
jgi:hypothetical protein